MKKLSVLTRLLCVGAVSIGMTACVSTGGSGGKTEMTGAAGGATSKNVNSKLKRCPELAGTVMIYDALDNDRAWLDLLVKYTGMTNVTPLLTTYVMQSHCFQVVNRSAAFASVRDAETRISRGGEGRSDSNYGKGQVKSADYAMFPTVNFSENTSGGQLGAALGGKLFGRAGAVVGGAAFSARGVSATILVTDVRSSIQVVAANGSASGFDIGGGLMGLLGNSAGGAGGFGRTPEGKAVAAAFADAYNQMVDVLIDYKPDNDGGAVGRGGRLKSESEQKYLTPNGKKHK